MTSPRAKAIAFYLPQFHPIPENDRAWGRGFTEWTNVVQGRPQFRGHYQPHLPADLGFYDLRLPEVRQQQADLARQYGIHGFCYYHFWFNGRRLLERPFQEILDSGRPDLPFCLCWANENWTRAWSGGDTEVIMAQDYSAEADLAHARWLAPVFRDRRYIRVDDKPLFLVYRASELPDARRTTEVWRREFRAQGVGEVLLGRVDSFREGHGDPTALGFDLAVQFVPEWANLGPPLRHRGLWPWACRLRLSEWGYVRHRVYDYRTVMRTLLEQPERPWWRLPGVAPCWDNTVRRRNNAIILHDSRPEYYEHWLSTVVERLQAKPEAHRLVFLNAWNEWAEGTHLEPDQRWGHAYLEATARALGWPVCS